MEDRSHVVLGLGAVVGILPAYDRSGSVGFARVVLLGIDRLVLEGLDGCVESRSLRTDSR